MSDEELLGYLQRIGNQGRFGPLCARLKLPEGQVRRADYEGSLRCLEAGQVALLKEHFLKETATP